MGDIRNSKWKKWISGEDEKNNLGKSRKINRKIKRNLEKFAEVNKKEKGIWKGERKLKAFYLI